MNPICIYHGNCADGYTAAWAVRKALGDDVDFFPGVYGQAVPDVAGRDVIMVDFSYKLPVIESIGSSAKSVLILDHHKTAQADLEGLTGYPLGSSVREEWERRKFGDETAPAIIAEFDMSRSGAQITWDFFNKTTRPPLVDYVGDRDLWRFDLPWSREVNAYVFSFDYTFENWDRLDAMLSVDIKTVAAGGAAIERKHHKDVAELVRVTKRTMIIGGYAIPVANIPYTLTSDAGNLMAKGERFAACYWDTPNGRVFSLRSTDDGMDVSAIAAQYGGGGHRSASGFQKPIGWEGDRPA